MKAIRLLLVLGSVPGFSGNLYAAQEAEELIVCEPSVMQQIRQLTTSQQYQQAVTLGEANLFECEGETEFDFYYGLASLESGDANQAVFALERSAATAGPGVLRERSRLELARAYFASNNLAAAESLFVAVLETNPPANVRQNIEAFLQVIETRRNTQQPSLSWTIASVIGSDDNINSATSNGLIDTPLVGQIELDQDGQQTEDNFTNTTLGVNYIFPFTRDRALTSSLNFAHLDNFDTDQFDIDSLRGAVNYGWGSQSDRIRHGVTASAVNLNGDSFQDSVGLTSSWQRNWGNGWYHTLSGSYSLIRFDDTPTTQNSLRDVNQLLLTASATRVTGALTHSFNLYHADEDPENPTGGQHNGRAFTGLAYSLLYRLSGQHTSYLRASIQDVEHDANHPVFFDTLRQDDTTSLTGGWIWQLMRNLQITGEVAYTDNTSNIVLFDFTRLKYQAGFRFSF